MKSFADMLLYINDSQNKDLSDSKMKNLNSLEQIYISSLMKNALKEAFKDENTITKLESEERKDSDMKENTKIMNIFEACEYVKKHNDEDLAQRHNERFTLHSDGKRVYTKFKKDDGEIIEKIVELDNAMMCSEWIRVEKKYLYVFTGYVNNKLVNISQHECSCDGIADVVVSKIQYDLYHKYRNKNSAILENFDPKVIVKYEKIYDEKLNPVISIKA